MLGMQQGKTALSDLNRVVKAAVAGRPEGIRDNILSETVISLALKIKKILPQILSRYLQELLQFQSIQTQEQVVS